MPFFSFLRQISKKLFSFLVLLSFLLSPWLSLNFTPNAKAYSIVEKTVINIRPGEVKRIFVSIKDKTNYNWYSGVGKTALYLYGDSSVFHHSSWPKSDLGQMIDQAVVKPGQLATASFYVLAPEKQGYYTERFLLGNNQRWHKNTVIQISELYSGHTESPERLQRFFIKRVSHSHQWGVAFMKERR